MLPLALWDYFLIKTVNQSALIMNCTPLPLNKIYRARFFLSCPHSLSCCALLNFTLENWEMSTAGLATATEVYHHFEIAEELSSCINLITQYGGSGAIGVNTIISHKTAWKTATPTKAPRPVGPVYHTHKVKCAVLILSVHRKEDSLMMLRESFCMTCECARKQWNRPLLFVT